MKLLLFSAFTFLNLNLFAQITDGLYVSSEDSFKENFYLNIRGDSATLYGWDLLVFVGTSRTDTIHYKACAEFSMLDSSYISMNFENHEFSQKSFLSENFDSTDIIAENDSGLVFPYLNMFGGIKDGKLYMYAVKFIYLSNTDNFIFELQTETSSLFSAIIQGFNPPDSTDTIKSLFETYPEFFESDYDTTGMIECTALLDGVWPTGKCRQSFVFTFKVLDGLDDSLTDKGKISIELWDNEAFCFMKYMEFNETEEDAVSTSYYGLILPDRDINLVLKLLKKYSPGYYYVVDAVLLKDQD
ncbi:hypothetical protein JW890_02090 [candidate division WOR-3 bacterium]|nr:hypothetical protein [candidate division WOR-3 bacterium]